MKKNVLLGIVAFGGLVLVATYLANNPTQDNSNEAVRENSEETQQITISTNFPTYPNAEASNLRESSSDNSDDMSFRLAAEATMSEVHTWYREALNQNGWHITSDKNVAGYQIIQAENENLYTSLQTANGANGQIIISQHTKIRK